MSQDGRNVIVRMDDKRLALPRPIVRLGLRFIGSMPAVTVRCGYVPWRCAVRAGTRNRLASGCAGLCAEGDDPRVRVWSGPYGPPGRTRDRRRHYGWFCPPPLHPSASKWSGHGCGTHRSQSGECTCEHRKADARRLRLRSGGGQTLPGVVADSHYSGVPLSTLRAWQLFNVSMNWDIAMAPAAARALP